MSKFEVGGYAYYSWGYDQTNIDWFKVVRRNDKSIWFEAVKDVRNYDNNGLSGHSVPSDEPEFVPNGYQEVDGGFVQKYEQQKFRKKVHVSQWQGENEVVVHTFGNIYPWDGKPKFFSEWA